MAERMQGRMARAEHLEEEARAESGGHAHEGRTGHAPDMIPMSEAESLRMDECIRQWQEQAMERMNPDRLPGDLRSYLSAPVKSEPTGHAVAMGPPTGHASAMSLPTFETGPHPPGGKGGKMNGCGAPHTGIVLIKTKHMKKHMSPSIPFTAHMGPIPFTAHMGPAHGPT